MVQQKKTGKTTETLRKRKLYLALLCIYRFYKLRDLLFLKSESFLKLCEVSYIDWKFNKIWLRKDYLNSKIEEKNWPFQISFPLECKTNNYGELIFFSSQKFLQSKKKFLKKIAFFVSFSLYFIENKEKMENIKQPMEWCL